MYVIRRRHHHHQNNFSKNRMFLIYALCLSPVLQASIKDEQIRLHVSELRNLDKIFKFF